jgi:hypothetical protein
MNMKFSKKAKNITIVTSAAIVAVCALTGIIYANGNAKTLAATDSTPSSSTATSAESATVSALQITGTDTVSVPAGIAGTGSAWNPASKKSVSAPLTITKKPSSTPPKPVIKQDAQSKKVLTDKTKKPSYTTPPQAPSTHKPAANHSGGSANKSGGSTKSGDNDPIFGNEHGTGGTVINENGNWGEGSQVGIMD